MGNWFTIDRLDSGTHIISEYRHWEETHCYLLHGRGTQPAHRQRSGHMQDKRRGFETGIRTGHTCCHAYTLGPHRRARRVSRVLRSRGRAGLAQRAVPAGCGDDTAMVVDRCELPEGFDVSGYEMFQGQPSRVLHDGDKIELGGRSVEVLHTPGTRRAHVLLGARQALAIYRRPRLCGHTARLLSLDRPRSLPGLA